MWSVYTVYIVSALISIILACEPLITRFMGQHGVHLVPTGPRWAPCWPHELCSLGLAILNKIRWLSFGACMSACGMLSAIWIVGHHPILYSYINSKYITVFYLLIVAIHCTVMSVTGGKLTTKCIQPCLTSMNIDGIWIYITPANLIWNDSLLSCFRKWFTWTLSRSTQVINWIGIFVLGSCILSS